MNDSDTNNVTGGITDLPTSVLDTSYAEDIMATAKKMHWVTSSICGTLFVIGGLIGNILSIIIWRKKKMRSSTGRYLIAQAVNDIGLLTFFFLTDSLLVIYPKLKTYYLFGAFYSYVGYPLFFFFVVNSIWTLVGVTIDRYIQVCWINTAKKICNEKSAKLGILLISVLAFVINAPHFNTFYAIRDDEKDAGFDAYDYTEFGTGKGGQVYEFWIHCMLIVLVPWITILVLNISILRRVAEVNKQMKDCRGHFAQTRVMRKENQLNKLLLTVTFTFLILIVLQCVTQCFFMMKPEISDPRIVNEAFSVAKLGLVINSSINFLLYCISGKKFRAQLRIMLYNACGCKCFVPFPDHKEMSSTDGSLDLSKPAVPLPTTVSSGSLDITTETWESKESI